MLNRLYLRFRSLFLRGRLEREMRDEMSLHIEQATARYMASGLTAEQARTAANREFGNMDYITESARDARGARWIETLQADVRFAFRHFRRTPLSTLTMIVVLSLGIGVNTALFTLLHAMRTMPPAGIVRDESLVRVRGTAQFSGRTTVERQMSYVEAMEFSRRANVFRDVTAFSSTDAAFDVGGEDGTFSGAVTYVMDNYFRVLSLRPEIGTGLPTVPQDADASAALVGVISHYLWQSRFGGTPDVIGRRLEVDNADITIVGVAPPNFAGTTASHNKNRVWLPLGARAVMRNTGSAALASPDSALFDVIAQLQPDVSVDQATVHARTIAAGMAAQRERRTKGRTESADVAPLLASNPTPNHDRNRIEEAAAGGAITLLILLITCTNVSALLLGLAVARRREIAVRLSLGAARGRIIRQLLTESMCLAVAAGSLGVFLVWIILQLLVTRVPELQQLLLLDAWALVFTFGFGLATGVLFGVSPALHATRVALADVLKDTAGAVSASRSWLQRGLIVAQIALTQPLLVGLGATVLVILEDASGDTIRADYDRIARMRVDYYAGESSSAQRRADILRLVERIAALPGVVAAVPADDGSISPLYVHPSDHVPTSSLPDTIMADLAFAPVGHFDLMGIPIVRGRDFLPEDAEQENAVIIASDLARELFGNADPIGRRFGFERDSLLTIVGIVDAATAGSSRNAIENRVRVYVPFAALSGSVLIRTHGPAEPMIPTLRAAAIAEVPNMPVWSIRTLEEIETSQRRTMLRATSAAAAGGLLALLLSAIGLYAVIAFAVGQRTREIGIRTALGAASAQVLRMFFLSGLRLAVVGLLLGLPLSLMALNVMASTFDMPRANVPILAALIAGAVVTVAGVATWVPARRAAGIDPLQALRSE